MYSSGVLSMCRRFVFPHCYIILHLCAAWPPLTSKMTGQEAERSNLLQQVHGLKQGSTVAFLVA